MIYLCFNQQGKDIVEHTNSWHLVCVYILFIDYSQLHPQQHKTHISYQSTIYIYIYIYIKIPISKFAMLIRNMT